MKKKFLVAACAATMAMGCAMTANAADTESGLVGYYTFDDTLANQASTNGGSAKVHGGAGDTWNSPAKGSATYVEGVNGKGYLFTGDVDSTRGEGLELDAKVTGEEFTLSGWIKASDFGVGTTSMMFAVNTVVSTNDACFSVNTLNGFNGSVLFGKIWDWDNRNNTFVCLDGDNSGSKFTKDKWTYITITGKSGEQKLYFNGELQAASTSTNALVVNNLKNATLFLGINWWDKSFGGIMDDVSLYERTLTAEDVKALYENSGRPVVDSNQVNTDPSVYVQYKKQTDGKYTVRVVGEVSLEGTFAESVNNTYNGVGFRCAKSASAVAAAESYASTVVFKSLVANGATVTAADGKYFVVTEITDVAKDATIYASPVYVKADKTVGTFTDKEYTIKMADIIK